VAFLQLLANDGTNRALQTFPIVGNDVVIGRAEDCGIHIEDPSVSRNHARLLRTAQGFVVQEMSPTNGILVGGQRVRSLTLTPGTVFQLGNLQLQFHSQDPRQAATHLVGEGAAQPPAPAPAAASPPAAPPPAAPPSPPPLQASGISGSRPASLLKDGSANTGRIVAIGLAIAGLVGLATVGWIYRDRFTGTSVVADAPSVSTDDAGDAPPSETTPFEPPTLADVTRPASVTCRPHVGPGSIEPTGDRATLHGMHGAPDAFAVAMDPKGSEHEELWDYRALGQQIMFRKGSYEGGTIGPAGEPAKKKPELTPWGVVAQPSPECIVQHIGPALWQTSAVVFPGHSDDSVAHLWRLAGGGTMATVGKRLVWLQYASDSAQPLPDEPPLAYVGELTGGGVALGALLTRGENKTRLSVSPGGRGTTERGVEHVIELDAQDGVPFAGQHEVGSSVRVRRVDRDGVESDVQATGRVVIKRTADKGFAVELDVRVGKLAVTGTGRLRNALWAVGAKEG
jgi:hypothetical protein